VGTAIENGTTHVTACVERIREMILMGELFPGQQLRQTELAERLNVSRIPLREAMAILNAEGALDYRLNAGYSVVRFDASAILQIYMMRELLETVLLESISEVPDSTCAAMTEILQKIDEASEHNAIQDIVRLNRQFHFAVLQLSSYKLIVAEVHQLWNHTALYSTFHAYDPEHRKRVRAEHKRFVLRAKRNDIPGLVELATQHRAVPIEHLRAILRGERPARLL
jgi:DNA-binding GntR family transcriptional regulator